MPKILKYAPTWFPSSLPHIRTREKNPNGTTSQQVFLDGGLLHPDNNFGEGLFISVLNGLYHCKHKKISATTSKHYHVDPDFFPSREWESLKKDKAHRGRRYG